MKGTLTAAILADHLVEGRPSPGEEIALRVDQVLTHDALGGLVLLQFASLGIERIRVPLAVVYADHNVFQTDPRMSRDHRFLLSAARRFGAYYARPGTGICHQVHLERFARPGTVLLGSDSHTPTAGGLGTFAVGAGGLDVTMALAGGPLRITCPRIVGVRLTGSLQPWVTAKDVILELLRRLSIKGGVGRVFEFHGPGVGNLTVQERATITNMCTELGATTALFPSDQVTDDFLRRVGREGDAAPLQPDPDSDYDEEIEIDLGAIEPLVARPSLPDNVVPVAEVEGRPVHQVLIGSCTNGAYPDLAQAAEILQRFPVARDVELIMNPSSRQSAELLWQSGLARGVLRAGGTISEATCGPCIGLTHVPAPGTVSVRAFNRNFLGRSGLRPDAVYLASPLVATVAAVEGRLRDPRRWGSETGLEAPRARLPESYEHSPHEIVAPPPPDRARAIPLHISSDMVGMPELSPLPDELEATVVGVFGDDVTTDDICPATPEALATMTDLPAMARFTFASLDGGFVERALSVDAGAVVAGRNYGQGSSRENAALAPRFLGVRVVMARSFARIHRSNLINWGILPLYLEGPAPELSDRVRLTRIREWLIEGGPAPSGERSRRSLHIAWDGREAKLRHDLNRRELLVVLAGGRMMLEHDRRNGADASQHA